MGLPSKKENLFNFVASELLESGRLDNYSYDCSEIAEDLFKQAEDSGLPVSLVRMEPNTGLNLKIIENNLVEVIAYHYVVIVRPYGIKDLERGLVYDLRHGGSVPLKYEEYFSEVVELNDGNLRLLVEKEFDPEKEMDKEIHEKLLVAKIIQESSRVNKGISLSLSECFDMLLTKEEVSTALVGWIKNYYKKGNWEDDLFYMISTITDLPSAPQRWKDNEGVSLEKRLQYLDFREWYEKMDLYLDVLIERYEPLYKPHLEGKRVRGYKGEVKDGKEFLLRRPIY